MVNQGIKALWQDAQQAQARHQQYQQSVLDAVNRLDPEIGSHLLEVFGEDAAVWLMEARIAMTDASPLESLAAGERQHVLDALLRIQYGVYT